MPMPKEVERTVDGKIDLFVEKNRLEQERSFLVDGRHKQKLMEAGIAIDVSEGPKGHGWSVRMEMEHEGKKFMKCIGFGADTGRFPVGWQDITEDEE